MPLGSPLTIRTKEKKYVSIAQLSRGVLNTYSLCGQIEVRASLDDDPELRKALLESMREQPQSPQVVAKDLRIKTEVQK